MARLLALCLGLPALASSGWAQSSVTLGWTASTDPGAIGYRVYQGGASANYTNMMDIGNATSDTIQNLTPGATYFFAVTAYTALGLESPFSNEISYTVPTTAPPPSVPVITFAADSGTVTAPFTASGGVVSQTVQTTVTTGGRAAYTFTITNAGKYSVSAQVNAPTEAANSFYVNIDAEPTDPLMTWDIHPLTSGFMSRTVSWRGNGTDTAPQYAPAVFALSAGTHQLIVRGREPNVQLGMLTIAPYLVITNCTKLASGNRTLNGTGVANQTCVLQAASGLTAPISWTAIATNSSDALGRFTFSDLKATNYTRRFYRIQGR